ncbi:uncharacterized protein MONBRDRAFT_33326 [Monosiga brevicollis MX1]|uniref:mRNA export factor n=1 Tax=Monosiga brevicollis TaxID=81824 RepID=A9V4R5_MONBE|nr:uncharacterized protein MONBRDRAFT_33326 [Monosiga brevicollis MX1]EDQ87417.1 predicted protein [Monosiga brevicollis MX1]|eukprot:XP_001747677.1 hypothetical protein [Monosiga brevicollis MX1]
MFGAAAASRDVEVNPPPGDTPQCIKWSPVSNHLAVGSWDSTVKVYEISPQGQSAPRQEFKFGAPVLDVDFVADGSKCVTAVADKTAQLCDLATGQTQQIAAHDAPVKSARFLPQLNAVMTASWDQTVKFWDMRSPNAVASFTLGGRCYSADAVNNLAAVVTSDRKVSVFTLDGGPRPFREIELRATTAQAGQSASQALLNLQPRVLRCFPSGDGFAVGSIEGRVAILYADPAKHEKEKFSFKCHRTADKGSTDAYAVNDIAFHKQHGTFATVGGNGVFYFWDKVNRNKLKEFPKAKAEITCCDFNGDGTLFAYGCGYDWSKGHAHYNQAGYKGVLIHAVQSADISPRPVQRR